MSALVLFISKKMDSKDDLVPFQWLTAIEVRQSISIDFSQLFGTPITPFRTPSGAYLRRTDLHVRYFSKCIHWVL
ncbi:hypothetical protein F2Q69_00016110 [Brassica cretica]|uniref:Uncharacterized protein n=1 Tax=Brassica cretica TaxID=69181 RepID=A0A8S9R632_BRACR|nr:hypothetical protein F2Q69_00016110 [Brassica cretica]